MTHKSRSMPYSHIAFWVTVSLDLRSVERKMHQLSLLWGAESTIWPVCALRRAKCINYHFLGRKLDPVPDLRSAKRICLKNPNTNTFWCYYSQES